MHDVVVGDVLDEEAVRRALEGCDAWSSAAAVFSLNPRLASELRRTNARAAEVVLTSAVEAGLDPVVHISSTVALTRPDGSGPSCPWAPWVALHTVEDRLGGGRASAAGRGRAGGDDLPGLGLRPPRPLPG